MKSRRRSRKGISWQHDQIRACPIPPDRVKALAIALLHDVMFWLRGN
jgi:hypothetical protein